MGETCLSQGELNTIVTNKAAKGKRAFPNAAIISDRFHVQKLMNEAISDLRVDYRWQAIDQENGVMKNRSKWTASQKRRAEIFFEQYPAIAEAYEVTMELTHIYNQRIDKGLALTKLARWYESVERLNCKFFNSVINTMQNNYATIVTYFDNRSTNASAESFNGKVKAFRAQFRGIEDIPFFIFRLAKLFA